MAASVSAMQLPHAASGPAARSSCWHLHCLWDPYCLGSAGMEARNTCCFLVVCQGARMPKQAGCKCSGASGTIIPGSHSLPTPQ